MSASFRYIFYLKKEADSFLRSTTELIVDTEFKFTHVENVTNATRT